MGTHSVDMLAAGGREMSPSRTRNYLRRIGLRRVRGYRGVLFCVFDDVFLHHKGPKILFVRCIARLEADAEAGSSRSKVGSCLNTLSPV